MGCVCQEGHIVTMRRLVSVGFRAGLALCAVLWAGLSSGCVFLDDPYGPDHLDPSGEAAPRITIGPGDTLEVKFIYTEDLDTEQEVRRDGCVTLPLVGRLKVAGLTCEEAEHLINKAYQMELTDPRVMVILRSQWSRRFYVTGEVNYPGIHTMPTRISILEAMVMAGGHRTDSAALDTVLVIRQEGDVRRVGTFDLSPSFGVKAPIEAEIKPFYLKPGDIVYVPATKIVRLDRWVDQHIHRVIRGLGVATRTGTTDVRYDMTD